MKNSAVRIPFAVLREKFNTQGMPPLFAKLDDDVYVEVKAIDNELIYGAYERPIYDEIGGSYDDDTMVSVSPRATHTIEYNYWFDGDNFDSCGDEWFIVPIDK